MKTYKTYSITILFLLLSSFVFGQLNDSETVTNEASFTIRGSVYERASRQPYKNVEILINGGRYTRTDFNGKFTVEVRIGDELTISHEDFDTIYHTVEKNERIDIEVIETIVLADL